jgi:hypothetical protein
MDLKAKLQEAKALISDDAAGPRASMPSTAMVGLFTQVTHTPVSGARVGRCRKCSVSFKTSTPHQPTFWPLTVLCARPWITARLPRPMGPRP